MRARAARRTDSVASREFDSLFMAWRLDSRVNSYFSGGELTGASVFVTEKPEVDVAVGPR